MKRSVLIVFSDDWLAYSPTVINLYDTLSVDFDVKIVAFEPILYSRQKLEDRNVDYILVPEKLKRVRDKLVGHLSPVAHTFKSAHGLARIGADRWLDALFLLERIRKIRADHIIAVDFLSLWAVQKVFGKGHLLSLEIIQDDVFYRRVDRGRIQSVIIQTEERYRYLFPDGGPLRFIVQNAPIYMPLEPESAKRKGLVFCGTAMRGFGIDRCLDYVAAYPESTLTIRGAVSDDERVRILGKYGDLVSTGRLFLSNSYVDERDIAKYLSQFYIGFSLYDTSLPQFNVFNYLTIPSGKLFNYFAAGVPVIGSNLPGLSPVVEFDAGILVNDLSPMAIHEAVEMIDRDYEHFSANCLKAAGHYSFDKSIKPFVDYLHD